MACRLPGHGACQKSRSNAFGGESHVLHVLKTWAIWGIETDSKKAHGDVWDQVLREAAAGTLPTEAELDGLAEQL